MRAKGSTFLEIATEAGNWFIGHGKKEIRTVKIRMKRLIEEFGSQPADQISPERIDLWIVLWLAMRCGKTAECRAHSLPVTR